MSESEDTSLSLALQSSLSARASGPLCAERAVVTGPAPGGFVNPTPVKRPILGGRGRRPAWLGCSDQPRVKAPARSQEKPGAPRGRIILLPTEIPSRPRLRGPFADARKRVTLCPKASASLPRVSLPQILLCYQLPSPLRNVVIYSSSRPRHYSLATRECPNSYPVAASCWRKDDPGDGGLEKGPG